MVEGDLVVLRRLGITSDMSIRKEAFLGATR